ncbi:pilus assembly PilX family protein [Pseudomonas sp. Marseille-Q8238]
MNARSQQSGMVLLISLVLLLMLTLIAIAAAHQSSLQTRMAANSQQQNIAFQAAESGLSAWIKTYESSPQIAAISTSGNLDDGNRVPYQASAAAPSNCWDVVPAYSLNAAEGDTSFQYACFNIESRSKACADAACKDIDNPARAEHFQGHLVRY